MLYEIEQKEYPRMNISIASLMFNIYFGTSWTHSSAEEGFRKEWVAIETVFRKDANKVLGTSWM